MGELRVSSCSQVARLKPGLWSSWPLPATQVLSPLIFPALHPLSTYAQTWSWEASRAPACSPLAYVLPGHMFGQSKCLLTGRVNEELCLIHSVAGAWVGSPVSISQDLCREWRPGVCVNTSTA